MTLTRTLKRVGDLEVVRYPALTVHLTLSGGSSVELELGLAACTVGTDPHCTLVSEDPSVSRQHLSLQLEDRGVVLRDVQSKNGTFVGGLQVTELVLPVDTPVRIGASTLWLSTERAEREQRLFREPRFGAAVGISVVMRALFETLSRAAASDVPVLLTGESGTGKDVLGQSIHAHSARRDAAFVVLDGSAVSPALLESELFGHERGAFSGAHSARRGLFAQAHGGTLFIDEVGELPLEQQSRLLRAIETKQVRPIGSDESQLADARVIAATHRDLRTAVRKGTFRQDLYFRLAVVEARVPPLRERKEDIPLLVESFLARQTPPLTLRGLPPNALELLRSHHWPGNVRELQNTLVRLMLFPHLPTSLGVAGARPRASPEGSAFDAFTGLPLKEAREALVGAFELDYLRQKLEASGGKVTAAAVAMGVSRQFVYLMMERYGLSRDGDE